MIQAQKRAAAAIEAFSRGEIVVIVDDDDRENEGDLIVAAELATPEQLALIIRHTSGIICAPLTREIADRLELPQMVAENSDPHTTAFTVSVDWRGGPYRSGISATERRNTARALADPASRPEDFMRPGHLFPLVAREGGVLARPGHTEAAVDLCQLAGLTPVGVIGELLNDDGSVMRGPAVEAFANEHDLRYATVADLVDYRSRAAA
ncbi:MAG: 3,4-dihydroxy-2-butanone-4-phosphate synthase [Bauldia sp.]|nr:3,4-dihydroxy-2-butanone-4-phosphate synthase [Bauldia sp.]